MYRARRARAQNSRVAAMRWIVTATLLTLGACRSVEPSIDPSLAAIAGTYDLSTQVPVDANATDIPSTVTYIRYDSDRFTLSPDGTWGRTYLGRRNLGATSTPITGTQSGRYSRSQATLTFTQGATVLLAATLTSGGMEIRDSYFRYVFARAP